MFGTDATAAADCRRQSRSRLLNGRELTLFEREPAKIGRLIDLLAAGNYRDTAATMAGITSR